MSVLRRYGRGLKLAARILSVELFGKPLKDSTTPPTDGQVLRYVAADQAWSPGTVSGGGGGTLASLTDVDVAGVGAGHVLWYDTGAAKWKTLAPGTSRRPLVSQGAASPSYAVDVEPLTQRIADGVTNDVSVCATITHDTTGGAGSDGIGARCVLRARNGSGAIADAGAIDGVLTTAAGGAEVGALDVRARAAGALFHVARFAASGVAMFAPTTINIADAATNAALVGLTVNRATSGTAAAGLAARVSMRLHDAGGTLEDAVYLDAAWTNAGASTEASVLDVHTRTGGAAARRVARFTAAGGMMLGAAVTQDPGVGGIAIPTTTGLYVESGATLYNLLGVFGAGVMTFGSGAFNCAITAFALTISSGGGTVISTGYLDLACGYRRRRTNVSDTNHTVTTAQSVIDVKGLTAARTVTLPAFADGLVVTITNSDGSADGTKTISVVASSGTNNINGVTTYVGINAAYGSVTLYCNSADSRWTVIAKV